MPRKNHTPSSEYPYHVTARCLNKEWFGASKSEIWSILTNNLYTVRHSYEVRILAFVLMDNHFHLLVQTPKANLSAAMNYFMRETSRSIGRITGRINHIYGSRYFRSLITNPHYYLHAYKYVYRNPVEVGLCANVEDYPYSSLHALLGQSHTIMPIEEDSTLFAGASHLTLAWLNTKPDPNTYQDVKNALRRNEFSLSKSVQRNKPNKLENELY